MLCMHFLALQLFSPSNIEKEIIRMNEKYRAEGKDLNQKQEGVELATIAQNAKEYSKIFARELQEGQYKVMPAKLVEIETNGKKRTLYLFNLNDSILHGTVSNIIHTFCQQAGIYSPNLKSYIKGENHWKTLKGFAAFVRAYHRSPVAKKERGLYILRRDIASYTDEIPVHDQSLLWPLLKKELKFPESPSANESLAWEYTRQVIQTEATAKNGKTFKKMLGVPTGSPISTTLFNFYSIELDRVLDSLSLQFYARYGDDIIAADTSRSLIDEASAIILTTLAKYELRPNQKKLESYYLNNAGRHLAHPIINTTHPNPYPGRTHILFLGCNIKADGTISLSKKEKNLILEDLKQRFSHIDPRLPPPLKLPLLCQAAAIALDPEQPLCQKSAILLRYNITDRKCLNEIDMRIALEVLYALTKTRSPRGFRLFPLHEMRKQGLPCLTTIRNSVS